jgi:hypothetical protein
MLQMEAEVVTRRGGGWWLGGRIRLPILQIEAEVAMERGGGWWRHLQPTSLRRRVAYVWGMRGLEGVAPWGRREEAPPGGGWAIGEEEEKGLGRWLESGFVPDLGFTAYRSRKRARW